MSRLRRAPFVTLHEPGEAFFLEKVFRNGERNDDRRGASRREVDRHIGRSSENDEERPSFSREKKRPSVETAGNGEKIRPYKGEELLP